MKRPATEAPPPPEPASGVLPTLKRRAEFLRVAKGQRRHGGAFSLQAAEAATSSARVGYTVTKATGCAPERNRIRRRLRAAVRAVGSDAPLADFVIIGRRGALLLPFHDLTAGLAKAMRLTASRLSDPHAARR